MTNANEQAAPASDTATTEGCKPESQTDKCITPEKEYGGPKGLEPTRYGDWEKAGRCVDF